MRNNRFDFGGDTVGVAIVRPCLGQVVEVLDRFLAVGCQFDRVLVPQLGEAKIASLNDLVDPLNRFRDSGKRFFAFSS